MTTTFRKDSKIRLGFWSGAVMREMEVDIVSMRPLSVRVAAEEFARLRREVTGRTFVDLRDARLDETLMTAQIERFDEGGILRLKRLDDHEQRQYVRVNVWLDFEHSALLPGEADDVLFSGDQAAELEAIGGNKAAELQAIARSEDAGAATLYLIRAIQAIDAKLDNLTLLMHRLSERNEKTGMQRLRLSLSGSGVRFLSPEPYDAGTLLKLRFRLMLKRVHEISAIAEVVRMEDLPGRDHEGRRRFAVACRFDRMRADDRELIVGFALHRQRDAIRRLNDAVEGF